jgi:hypothetical protein
MRIRSIKPEYWRSADITNLDIADRFLFIGLWSYVDDSGSGIDDEATIIGDLFARDMFRDPRETVARVSRGLLNLFEAGLIIRYTSSGKSFLHITNWEKHQRIDKPGRQRYPRPDDENVILATSSRDSRDTLAPGTGEQGNRGTGEQVKNSSAPAVRVSESDFESAWAHWPKKVERKKSFEKFKAAAKTRGVAELVADIIRFGDAYSRTTERQYTPALNVWLNGERWTDELPTASTDTINAQWDAALAEHKPDPCANGHKWVGDGSCARYPCAAERETQEGF